MPSRTCQRESSFNHGGCKDGSEGDVEVPESPHHPPDALAPTPSPSSHWDQGERTQPDKHLTHTHGQSSSLVYRHDPFNTHAGMYLIKCSMDREAWYP